MKSKFFSVLLALILVLSVFNFKVSAEENAEEGVVKKNRESLELTDKEVDNLLSLGFTEEEIQNMDQEEYELNKDLDGEVVASTTQYLKIVEPIESNTSLKSQMELKETDSSEPTIIELDKQTYYEELEKEKQSSGQFSTFSSDSTSTSYKKMTTTITKLSTNNYRLKNSVSWSKLPSTRHVDVSGVGINQTYWGPTPGTQYGKQNWKTWSYCNGYQYGSATYTSGSSKWQKGAGGYALRMNLPDDETTGGCAADRVETLSSYMYYSVSPLATTNRLDAYGHFAHQESKSTLVPGISLSGVSFSVSPSTSFSEHPNTHILEYK